jgi:hypothetical protein
MERKPLGGIDEVAKAHEMNARDHEIELKHFELYHEYDKNVRARVDTIAKGIYLIGGGALTLSIGIFTRPDRPILDLSNIILLKISWGSLFLSVTSLMLVQLILLIRMSAYSAAWGKKLKKEPTTLPNQVGSEIAAWGFGLLGFGACILGLFLLSFVSVSVLN